MITLSYTRSNARFTFSDALILDEKVYASMSQEDVIAVQDARFAAWLSQVEIASDAPIDEVTSGN